MFGSSENYSSNERNGCYAASNPESFTEARTESEGCQVGCLGFVRYGFYGSVVLDVTEHTAL